jgi:hypothetical protein
MTCFSERREYHRQACIWDPGTQNQSPFTVLIIYYGICCLGTKLTLHRRRGRYATRLDLHGARMHMRKYWGYPHSCTSIFILYTSQSARFSLLYSILPHSSILYPLYPSWDPLVTLSKYIHVWSSFEGFNLDFWFVNYSIFPLFS